MSPTSKSKLSLINISLVFVWLVGTVFAAYYFVSKRMTHFDSNNQLANVEVEQLFKRLNDEGLISSENSKAVIHFTADGCHCNKVPESHKVEIDKLVRSEGFEVSNRKLSDQFTDIVPAAPSVIVVDNGQLVYLGPYSAGYSCSKTNSFVDMAINNHLQGFTSDVVVSDVTGCFCQV
ncbi:DUF6436 domain-containing protein [Psychrosphaera haliotis]|uniref:DUF6436 domain-containing protein n=1 Tax=Psychrosphaera haliotis TaxID=555083 RepID=A0A6N8FC69_9GAMM|nr:DUF6436 domain-containing protein [Psychrosphaera haliotis]MUH72590.1 hypothetical protein [Psychrosphaera haliotis]